MVRRSIQPFTRVRASRRSSLGGVPADAGRKTGELALNGPLNSAFLGADERKAAEGMHLLLSPELREAGLSAIVLPEQTSLLHVSSAQAVEPAVSHAQGSHGPPVRVANTVRVSAEENILL